MGALRVESEVRLARRAAGRVAAPGAGPKTSCSPLSHISDNAGFTGRKGPTVFQPPAAWLIITISPIGHWNLVLFKDVSPPHALCIVTRIGSPAERAAKTGFLAFRPILALELIFTPTPGRFQVRRVLDSIGVCLGVVLPDVVIHVKKPIGIFLKVLILEAIRIFFAVGELGVWRMNEDGVRIGGQGIHAGQVLRAGYCA